MEFKNLDIEMRNIGEEIVKVFKAHAKKHQHTGELYRSIKLKIKDYKMVINMAEHAKFLDEGRKPGKQPPIDAIRKWASSKGLNVWALAKSISKRGTKAYPFLYKWDDIVKKHKKALIKAGSKDIKKQIKKTLKK